MIWSFILEEKESEEKSLTQKTKDQYYYYKGTQIMSLRATYGNKDNDTKTTTSNTTQR